MAGISGAAAEGADSIVLSGGYEDDEDFGDVIIYSGHGGQEYPGGPQVRNQELTRGNLALAKSCIDGLPVRVVRGWEEPSAYAPGSGYRYDGLYFVDDYGAQRGLAGFQVWRYRLVAQQPVTQLPSARQQGNSPAPRVQTTVQRLVRNTDVVRRVKLLHNYRCQTCGERIDTPAGPYAEGAHIRPLGEPHNGPDIETNVLCLCPNCHVRFDVGALVVLADFALIDFRGTPQGSLRLVEGHSLSPDHLTYYHSLHNL